MPDTVIKMSIVGDASGVQIALRLTDDEAKKLSESLRKVGSDGKRAGDDIKDGMDRSATSIREAREAAKLFGEETGVHIPRALAGILAKSETLGPLLESAFSVVAVAAFAELAVKAGEKLAELASNTFVFTDSMKEMSSALAKDNQEIEQTDKHITDLSREIEAFGKSATEVATLKLGWKADDVTQINEQIALVTQRLAEAKAKGDENASVTEQILLGWREMGIETGAMTKGETEIATLQGQLGVLQKKAQEAGAEMTLAALKQNEVAEKAAQKQAEERLKIEERINSAIAKARAELNKELDKGAQGTGKLLGEQLKTELEGELKLAQATEKNEEAQLKYNAAIAKSAAERQADLVEQDKATNNIQKAQADTATLIQLLEKQKQAELAIVDAKIRASEADMKVSFQSGGINSADFQSAQAAWENYQAQRVQVAAEADKKIQQANDNMLKQDQKELQQYLQTFNQEFASAFAQVATGHETLAKAATKMYEQMTTTLITNLVKAMAAEVEGAALHKTLAAEKQFSDAKGAAAGAYNALAGIPYIGPIIAPIAAAGAFAAVMAFDEGGMVPMTQMALVHSGEAVLTPSQTQNLQAAADNMGGGTTHNHNWNISAMDGASVHRVLKNNLPAVGEAVEAASAKGHLSLSRMAKGK
jgi:hypothetical protein